MNAPASFAVFVAGFALGATGVWFALSSAPQRDSLPETPVRSTKRVIAEPGDRRQSAADENSRLRERVIRLERELVTAKAGLTAAQECKTALAERPLSYDEWFALQREANPERYRVLTNNLARCLLRVASDNRMRSDILGTVDVSGFDAGDAAVHAEYRAVLSQIAELRLEEQARRCVSQDFQAENPPEFQQRMETLRRRAGELAPRERFRLLEEAGRLHGLGVDAARELATTLHLVIETTSGAKRFLKPQREGLSR